MEYKVIPFTATLNQEKETVDMVANQLQTLIARHTQDGWRYIRLEGVSTFVQPENGCFGIGAKPGYMASYQMAVFSKEQP